jgi:MazG family protein
MKVSDAGEVSRNWEELKQKEGKNSVIDGLPKTMPALVRSQALQRRAAQVGFDWKELGEVLEKVAEELEELKQAKTSEERISEFGDLIFALANVARWLEIDLESALHLTNERFCRRFSYIENACRKRGIPIQKLSFEELDDLWEEAKRNLS